MKLFHGRNYKGDYGWEHFLATTKRDDYGWGHFLASTIRDDVG